MVYGDDAGTDADICMENWMLEAEARSDIGTCTPANDVSPSSMFLKVTRSPRVSATPSMVTSDWPAPLYDISKEVIDIPRGRKAAKRSMTGDKVGDTDDDRALTRDPAVERPAVIGAVSVAMPLSADWAFAAADLSAKLDIRYEGKRKTVAMMTAKDIKKNKTMKNLTWYSVLRALTVFDGRSAWYMDFFSGVSAEPNRPQPHIPEIRPVRWVEYKNRRKRR